MTPDQAMLETIVDRQLIAYNQRDLDTFCACWTDDAVVADLDTGNEMAAGIVRLRDHYRTRFSASPHLRAIVIARMIAGSYVIDHERVWGIGPGPVETIAHYRCSAGKIAFLGLMSP